MSDPMETKPLVSIITPTYDHEAFISQCIDSVLRQTYANWELIIVDDGSRDGTRKIVEGYVDHRITYIRNINQGIWKLNRTYNTGLRYARGDLIAVLEGDDFWPADKLEKQVGSFAKTDVVLSWGKAIVTNSKGEKIETIPKNAGLFDRGSRLETHRELIMGNFIPACTVMCRRDALLEIGGFKQVEYTPYIDYPTWLRLIEIGEFCPVNETLGYWRRHGSQVSATMLDAMVKAYQYSIEYYHKIPDNRKKDLRIDYARLDKKYREKLSSYHFYCGRIALVDGDYGKARSYFRKSFTCGHGAEKIKSALGILASYTKRDIEDMVKLLGYPSINDMV